MELIKIGEEIFNTCKRISEGTNKIYKFGTSYADAEKTYRIALAKEIMILREQKIPATLVGDIARGNLADLKYKRDFAEMQYKTSRDMLNALQSELSGLQTLYNKQTEV